MSDVPSAEKAAPPEGRYVIEVWGAGIGPGELLTVISDALAVHGTKHGRIRVSYSSECPSQCGRNDPCPDPWHDQRPIPPAKGSGYCPDACTWPHDHHFERDGVPWPARTALPPAERTTDD